MKKVKLQFGLFLMSLCVLLFAGCSRTSVTQDADARGYFCQQCKFKFFTDNTVWASVCPSCKAGGPAIVTQLVCPADKTTWILEPGAENKCPKCGATVEAFRQPQAKDLQAWGAVKKTEQEVAK